MWYSAHLRGNAFLMFFCKNHPFHPPKTLILNIPSCMLLYLYIVVLQISGNIYTIQFYQSTLKINIKYSLFGFADKNQRGNMY